MRPFLTGSFALLIVTGCSGGSAPVAFFPDSSGVRIPIYHLEPQRPEDRPLIVNQPFELEAPEGSAATTHGSVAAEVGHENSIRLYGPGVSTKRQTLTAVELRGRQPPTAKPLDSSQQIEPNTFRTEMGQIQMSALQSCRLAVRGFA